jgi:hypothetical protein
MKNIPPIGPYSRVVTGQIGARYTDNRTRLGRKIKTLTAQLVKHAGGEGAALDSVPITTRLLIERIVAATIQIEALDAKLAAGEGWTDHDSRTHNGLINRQRLLLREIGMKPTVPAFDLDKYMAEIARQSREQH